MAELSKAYEPQAVEEKWYARWLADGCFTADPASAKPAYSIVIPPPNVTGVLTMGHVLNNTIQDILARRARMEGKEVLWLPGTDHAGIATQTVVERKIRKEEGKTRRDLGREKFLGRVWEWKEKHGGIIIQQLKRLGCSCDWTRERFTMDADYSRAVQRVFVDLYRKGLIYRGRDGELGSGRAHRALRRRSHPEAAETALYYVRYELVDEPGRFIEVATTRPETILADVAVAVNPDDPRYRSSLGKKVWRPLDRAELPIIGDRGDRSGIRHRRAEGDAGARQGRFRDRPAARPAGDRRPASQRQDQLARCPELDGLDRFEARKKAVELLAERGLLAKEEPYENKVGFSERADVPIEPRLSEQWFLKYPRVEEARAAVGPKSAIHFRPERWERFTSTGWRTSRTGASAASSGGGIASRCGTEGKSEIRNPNPKPPAKHPRRRRAAVRSGELGAGSRRARHLVQLALAVCDDGRGDAQAKFYPTTDLVTGPDIIFFWVARMIMAGFEFMGRRRSATSISPASSATSRAAR